MRTLPPLSLSHTLFPRIHLAAFQDPCPVGNSHSSQGDVGMKAAKLAVSSSSALFLRPEETRSRLQFQYREWAQCEPSDIASCCKGQQHREPTGSLSGLIYDHLGQRICQAEKDPGR
ncbi:unnamed protein product [Leuciscus chuanchicus]